MEKYQCFATNIFWSQKCDFFGDFGQKTRTAGLIMLKLSTNMNQVFWEKNLENENFMRTAVHCENWYFKKTNIFHYFPSKNLKYSQIFLSETIHAQENGSRGPHFAKSLNSNFLKGLTYSALTHSVMFSRLDWCDPGVWRCLLKTCWGCYCCLC